MSGLVHLVGPVVTAADGVSFGYLFEGFNRAEGRTRSAVYRDFDRARHDRTATLKGLEIVPSATVRAFHTTEAFDAAVKALQPEPETVTS